MAHEVLLASSRSVFVDDSTQDGSLSFFGSWRHDSLDAPNVMNKTVSNATAADSGFTLTFEGEQSDVLRSGFI